jgi:hypothetical protein
MHTENITSRLLVACVAPSTYIFPEASGKTYKALPFISSWIKLSEILIIHAAMYTEKQ